MNLKMVHYQLLNTYYNYVTKIHIAFTKPVKREKFGEKKMYIGNRHNRKYLEGEKILIVYNNKRRNIKKNIIFDLKKIEGKDLEEKEKNLFNIIEKKFYRCSCNYYPAAGCNCFEEFKEGLSFKYKGQRVVAGCYDSIIYIEKAV